MNDRGRFYQRLWIQLYIFPFLASLPFYREWLAGLKGLFTFLLNLAKYVVPPVLFRGPVMQPAEIWAPLDSSVRFILLWVILYILLYKLNLFIMVQFLLPINRWEDRKKAFNRISLFARGKHGAAIFIKNGEQITRRSEMDSKKPGVALVDLSSAIVLTQNDNAKTWYLPDEEEIAPTAKKKSVIQFPWQNKKPDTSFYEAKGPGVVFIENGQRIHSIINLRKQTRTSEEVVVYTRNGIKIKSTVSVVFSLSDEPDILTVGYVGGTTPSHLKILNIKEDGNNITIESVYNLDQGDAEEVLHSIQNPFTALSPSENLIGAPYTFDKDRVLQAALSQARNKSSEAIYWHESPLEAATDIFRATLAEIPYDNLFNGSIARNLPNSNAGDEHSREGDKKNEKMTVQTLSRIRDDFSIKVKLRGMISFQFIEHMGGSPFYKGQNIPLSSVKKYAPVPLAGEKFNFFRDRGIVVKKASFGEILAVEEGIQKRMVGNWMAKMKNEIAISNAEYELEAIRVHNRNRALLQEEMTHLLAGVFQSTPHFDEALALRVLQALETSITEMSDVDMQSIDIYELLKNLHDWILFDESRAEPPSNGAGKTENEQE
jgi:hypothetical protein